MLQEMEDSELQKKYFTLDLNEDMMRADLKELGIKPFEEEAEKKH